MPSTSLLLFGDQTISPAKSVKDLCGQSQQSVLITTFLRNTSQALRPYVEELNIRGKDGASFRDVLELADQYMNSGDKSSVATSTLLCISQIGSLILYSEKNPTFLENAASDQYLIGLCTGLLPAAAVAAAKSVSHLVQMGPEIVCIALRLGLAAQQRSFEIETGSADWTLAVSTTTVKRLQGILVNFNDVNMLPRHRHVYISAIGDRSATISGPPSTIAALLEHETELASTSSSKLGINAAYHAEHLSCPDVEHILGTSAFLNDALRSNFRIISTSSGKALHAQSLKQALKTLIKDILQLPLRFDLLLQNIVAEVKDYTVNIIPCGPCGFVSTIHQAFVRNNINVSILGNPSLETKRADLRSEETIAVVGMAGRFPGADTLDEFWDVIESGRDLHKKVPKDRFDASTHCDPSGKIKNSTLSAYGCFINQPGMFDTRLFNMSPREALQTDPIQRQLLMVTYEALESAGYVQDGSPESLNVGTFFGVTADDYREYNSSQDVDVYYITGGLRAFAPGRLNYHFKWEGPSFSLDTACSSSAAAIDLACQSILSGKCHSAVAGGGSIMTGPNLYAGLSRGGFLSPTGSSKTFDDSADGYCRGDAVGVVVLKRLSDAIASGDNVRGIIRSVATNHSAYAASITLPHAPSQKKLFEKVLQDTGLSPNNVSYVELHGTGTQAGDTIEMNSVVSTFAVNRPASNPLYVGAVKANVGHGEGAAGITSTIKAMLMFRENVIPPHAGIKTRINSKFPPLHEMNVRIARSIEEFRSGEDGKKRVWINNFNATGGNTCLVIEEPPQRDVYGADPRSHHIVTVSAKTAWSLKQNQKRLHDYLVAHPDAKVQDVAYTTTARRQHHPIRSTYTSIDTAELIQVLSKELSSDSKPVTVNGKKAVVFSFAGQGSQHAGMGKQLFETSSAFCKTVLDHEALCNKLGLPSFVDVINNGSNDIAEFSPVQVHCAILSLEIALAKLWISWGIKPDMVMGHSIGEYCALHVAGVLSLADAFFLVSKRAELLERNCKKYTHTMVVISASKERVSQLIESQLSDVSCHISCVNASRSTVVSISVDALARLETAVGEVDLKSTRLDVPYAFHSSQMDPILDDFQKVAAGVQFNAPQIPVASTLLGEVVDSAGTFSAPYLVRQTRKPVNFLGAVQAASNAYPHALWIEHGPDSTCSPAIRATLDDCQTIVASSLRGLKEDSWKTISKTMTQAYMSGVQINWQVYHREYVQALRLVDLPTYAFDMKNYWLQYEGTWALERNHHRCPEPVQVVQSQIVAPAAPLWSSTCLQQVTSEDFTDGAASVEFLSTLNKPGISDLISGHFVNGVSLCPSAVYADMALTAAKYVFSNVYPAEELLDMDVRDFEIVRPLVLRSGDDDHIIKISATKTGDSKSAQITISSQSGSGIQSHARCWVDYGDAAFWKRSWQRNSYLIRDRIDQLTNTTTGSAIDRLRGEMVYKIFSEIVEYPEGYKGIKELSMNGSLNEAVAKLKFRKTPSNTTFTCDPCWIDTIAQVAGFVLNGSTSADPALVFLSTGWESLKVTKSLSHENEYMCYVRMQPSENPEVLLGDATIFDGNEIVALASGLKFHGVRKDVLHKVLPGSRNLSGKAPEISLQTSQSIPSTPKPPVTPKASVPTKQTQSPSRPKSIEPVPDTSKLFSSVLQFVAEEVGIGLEDLTDDAIFEDLGVDSLLTISIGTKVKDRLQLDLPLSIFSQCQTVAQLCGYFQQNFPGSSGSPRSITDDSSTECESESESDGYDTGFSSATSVSEESFEEILKVDIVDVIIAAIAKESGMSEDELDPDTDFADLGVDSLMTIAILGVVTAQTGEQLPASVFSDHPTISALRKGLGKQVAPAIQQQPLPKPIPQAARKVLPKPKFQAENYRSNVVLLQGDPKSAHPPLFLIADGAGSAASYLHFPQFPSRLPVYGLESPFLNRPSEFTCSIEEVCQVYVAAIRAKRPHGPYFLGGWSIGGIYTYESTRQLVALGERVEGVLLIDSPCPHKMEGLPPLTLEVLEETGIFVGIPTRGGGPDTPMPLGQKQHITGCVQAASSYDAKPLEPSQRPSHTYIIWSERGLFEQLSEKVKEASEQSLLPGQEKTGINRDWLTGTRTSFGPKGWDRLLGDCECHPTDGDHFSCMNLPRIRTTGKLVADAVETFLQKMTMPSKASSIAATVTAPKITFESRNTGHSTARAVFDEVRVQTVDYLKDTGCQDFCSQVYPLQRLLVLTYVVEAFAQLGVDLKSLAAGELVPEIQRLPLHDKLAPQLYRILEDAFLISIDGDVRRRTKNPVDTTTSQSLYREILRRFPNHACEHKLLNVAGSRLAGVLTGEVDYLRILFQDNRDLLSEVYRYGPMFDATSKQLSEFILQLGQKVPQGQQIRILEIGGGLGGTTRPVIDMLLKHNIPFSYTFSDISGSLVAAARKKFSGTPNMEFAALDVEKMPAARFKNKYDLIFSTNCVHATRNLAISTANIRTMLRPDGVLSLVEYTENLFWFDIVFGLLEGWWLFEDGREHVLADEAFWRQSLQKAGYGHVALTDGATKESNMLRIISAFQPGS